MRIAHGLLTAGLLCVAGRAAALSCDDPAHYVHTRNPAWSYHPFGYYDETGAESLVRAPLDVQPWHWQDCNGRPALDSQCRLVSDSGQVAVTLEADGLEICDSSDDAVEYIQYFVLRYVPAQPLAADTLYALECDGIAANGELWTRADGASASPPTALADIRARARREDSSCCGEGQFLELRMDHVFDAPFMKEGGHVEVVYEDTGRVVPVAQRGYEEGIVRLPETHGPLTLTPVAANGARGEPLRIEDYREDLAYIPCTVGSRTTPPALWLLGPLAYIFMQGRRQRRSA